MTYTYDLFGRRNRLTVGIMDVITKYDGNQLYGDINRVKEIRTKLGTYPEASYATFQYYSNDLLKIRDQINANRARYTYDEMDRPLNVHHETSNGLYVLNRHQYVYDPIGRVTQYHIYSNASGGLYWYTNMSYDRANRLRTENRHSGPSGNYNFAYNYDKNDNRTSTVRNGNTFNYGYGDFNRINFGERVSPNTSGGFVFASYDSNGNPGQMTYPSGTVMSIQYDLKQQVTQMNIGASQIVKNSYDFLKRRYKKEDTAGATQFFVYDGDRMIAETDANKVITTYHIEGIGMIASNADRRFYRENAIGSACAIGHGGGGQESETLYDAYGVERYASGQTALRGPLRFAGKHGYFSNGETGFQTLGQREYIPLLGRFLTQDPIGQLDNANVYTYADCNPLTMIDPTGLASVGEPGLAESMVPIWGSTRQAVNDFQNGRIGWGLVNTALAVSDVFLVGTVAKSVATVGVKGSIAIGSQSWKATRQTYRVLGLAEFNGQQFHHIIKQKYYLDNKLMKMVMNQSFMVTKLKQGYSWGGKNWTMHQFHQLIDGRKVQGVTMSPLERAWYGSNDFHKVAAGTAVGKVINSARPDR